MGSTISRLSSPLILGDAARVMSLRDGSAKMSKSDSSDNSRINLTDGADAIARKIRRARTDAEPLPGVAAGLAGRPEADNLVSIYASFANRSREEVCRQFEGAPFSKFKEELTALAVAELSPITTELRRLLAEPGYLERAAGGRRGARPRPSGAGPARNQGHRRPVAGVSAGALRRRHPRCRDIEAGQGKEPPS